MIPLGSAAGFEFATATRILFGSGASKRLPEVAGDLGTRALFVRGSDPSRLASAVRALNVEGVYTVEFAVPREPDVGLIEQGVDLARTEHCDMVIGFGGGSALDAGKAIAALATNPGELLDYLEVIGRGKTLSLRPLPYIAVPTTAGTGSEVTKNAVIASPEHRVKVSLRSPAMLPVAAIVDPDLTANLPPSVTASTGLDALTQVLEPFVCARANPMIDAFCLDGIRRAGRALRDAVKTGSPESRANMSLVSLFGGLALANAGLGAVHGFAGPIGGMFSAPHGAVCAALLPHVMEANIHALRTRTPDHPSLQKYAIVAQCLLGDASASADDGVNWVRALVTELRIPQLSAYGLKEDHIPDLVSKAAAASSMKPNPVVLTPVELHSVLLNAL